MQGRRKALLDAIDWRADGVLILSPVNRRYFTGFDASDGALLLTRRGSVFLTDFRYIEAAKAKIKDLECLCYDRFYDCLLAQLDCFGVGRLLIEEEYVTVRQEQSLRELLEGKVKLAGGADQPIFALRSVKSAQEIQWMQQAQDITDQTFTHMLSFIREGASEREIALELEFFMRRLGSEGVAFETIAASGPNTSLPHAVPTDRKVRKGDFVTMDFGAVVNGYCADMTRTVAVGEVSEEQRAVYEVVLKAQQTALSTLGPDVLCSDGDAAARDVIEAAGYGKDFGHATGHSVGLQIHEDPRLSPKCQAMLVPGTTMTVEPGIYLEGRFGVRIEDLVVITEQGFKNLTKSEKSLIIL